MDKHYSYKNITAEVSSDYDVAFSIKALSSGNIIDTIVNVPELPPDKDPYIHDEGKVNLGLGSSLSQDTYYIVSVVTNLIPQEDEIKIAFKINDKVIVEHINSKSDARRIIIIIHLNFTLS